MKSPTIDVGPLVSAPTIIIRYVEASNRWSCSWYDDDDDDDDENESWWWEWILMLGLREKKGTKLNRELLTQNAVGRKEARTKFGEIMRSRKQQCNWYDQAYLKLEEKSDIIVIVAVMQILATKQIADLSAHSQNCLGTPETLTAKQLRPASKKGGDFAFSRTWNLFWLQEIPFIWALAGHGADLRTSALEVPITPQKPWKQDRCFPFAIPMGIILQRDVVAVVINTHYHTPSELHLQTTIINWMKQGEALG